MSSNQTFPKAKMREENEVKNIIAVMSGKGGVGKSLVTSLLAVEANRAGKKVGILDADLIGASIPSFFGIKEKMFFTEDMIYPVMTPKNIEVVSIGLLMDKIEDPLIWRGPLLSATVKQFFEKTIWHKLDYLFLDLPPGTGDVALTVMQSFEITGIVIVATPSSIVCPIVEKSLEMAKTMNTKVVGLVENMSCFVCPHCKNKTEILGKSEIETIRHKYNIINTEIIPYDNDLALMANRGKIEEIKKSYLASFLQSISQ